MLIIFALVLPIKKKSFEKRLEATQELLGIDTHNYVPVAYVSKLNWFQKLLLALLVGFRWYMTQRIQPGGFGIGGRGHEIFNIGKAQITKLDKNFENKVSHGISFTLDYLIDFSLGRTRWYSKVLQQG